jgi:isoleucyl-tRNA synthetase
LREQTRLKTRQPLERILVATTEKDIVEHVQAMQDVITEETNIRQIEFISSDSELLKKKARANFKVIGPKYGKQVKAIAARIAAFTNDDINKLERDGTVTVELDGVDTLLDREDVDIQHDDIEGWTIGADGGLVVALDTTLTDDLIDEGHAREFVSKIQNLRKEGGFDVTDRIVVTWDSEESELVRAIVRTESYICSETLAVKILKATMPAGSGVRISVNDLACDIHIVAAEIG